MKKALFFCLTAVTVLLAACSSEGTGKETVEKEAVHQQQQQTNEQYYNVLIEAVDSFGYPKDGMLSFQNEYESGVLHAELVDFNNDGIDELYLLMRNAGYITTDYEHRNAATYIQEVWSFNPKDETPTLTYASQLTEEECVDCEFSTAFVEDVDGNMYIKQQMFYVGHGIGSDKITIASLQKGKQKFDSFQLVESSIPTGVEYYKDDTIIEQAAYEQELEKYTNNEKIILGKTNDTLTVGYGSSSSTNVSQLLEILGANQNNVLNSETVENEEVVAALDKFESHNMINVLDPNLRLSQVFHTLMETELPSSFDDTTFRTVYTFDDVAAAYEERFGTTLTMEDVENSNNPEDVISFENNAFYVLGMEYYVNYIDRKIEQIHAVSDHVFYLKLVDVEFDADSYYMSTEGMPPALKVDIPSLPEEAKQYFTTNITRYAVVKLVDGSPKVQYIGIRNLSDDELAAFN